VAGRHETSLDQRKLKPTGDVMAQLERYQQWNLEHAKQALAASKTDTDTANFPRQIGALEVTLADMIQLVEHLIGNA
jgi:hypothetical protein